MIATKSYAAYDAKSPLKYYEFSRRTPTPNDVHIQVLYCGVCHSDIHQVRDEWGGSLYPMVPGHEIVGKVVAVGASVKKFKVGDLAAVGCMVDSCRTCHNCKDDLEQFCNEGFVPTYNGLEKDGETLSQGGYSDNIVVDEAFTLKVPDNLNLAAVAPLLCAGITTYSPLRHWKVGPGQKVGIVGLGGLGHMALKFAASFGAHPVLFTTSNNKHDDAVRFGAKEVVLSKDADAMALHNGTFDFILNTVSANIDLNIYLNLLKREGSLVLVGVPEKPAEIHAASLIFGRKRLGGSLIGGIAETKEMLDYCAKHQIVSDIELIPIDKINVAYERMLKSDVKYRFVIDMQSLAQHHLSEAS